VRTDYDSPWKDILETYFQPALELCFPRIARQINWSKGVQLLSTAPVMVLTAKLEREVDQEIEAFEKSKRMKYITHMERRGLEKGRQEGRQEGQIRGQQESVLTVLETRFGEIPYALREAVTATDDLDRLKQWHRIAIQLASLAEFEARLQKR